MNEDVYKPIIISKNNNILELPVCNLTIIGVTGVHSKRITKQIFVICRRKNRSRSNTYKCFSCKRFKYRNCKNWK